jgi:hypothetical protein
MVEALEDKAGDGWGELSKHKRTSFDKAEHMRNENHETMLKDIVDIRSLGICTLEK